MPKLLAVIKKEKIFLAKPSGITLEEHVANVISEAKIIQKIRQNTFSKYNKRTGESLEKRLEFVCKYHDEGKKTPKWQTACQKDYQHYKIWKKCNEGNFDNFKKDVGDDAGKNIRNAKVRHEIASLKRLQIEKLPLSVLVAIAAHHSKLSRKHQHRWIDEDAIKYWKYFDLKSNKNSECFDLDAFDRIVKVQYETAALRSLLQLSDRRASAKEEGCLLPDFKKFVYEFPFENKRGVQTLVNEKWDSDLLLIRAPTGAGKTDASLLWAKKQIQNGRADRLIIAMPTRFTSTALSISVTESLSETGLYHSSAWFNKFQDDIENNKIRKEDAKSIHEFARLLETTTTVCTIDHLLTALTLSREDHHHITFNMANSCLVIDEADFYDEFVQENILVLLRALKVWNVPVLLMSASLPECVIEEYRKIGYDVPQIYEDKSDSDRDRFEVKSIVEYTYIDEISDILDKCIEKGVAIIYANTVDSARKYYDYFEARGVKPILYHSRFTEPDKKKKEDELISKLGKEAWKRNDAQGIAIMTQIGEMSINISAEIMISEICPIDRLTQRAGRLCRFENDKIGDLFVLIPLKDNKIYPAPYGTYQRKEKNWEPVIELTKTKELLKLQKYNPDKLVELLNTIYNTNKEKNVKSIENARTLKEMFKNNWLINPVNQIDKEGFENLDWKSRDIPPQESIYICKPDNYFFYSYNDFNSWKIEHSIELPLYQIEKLLKNGLCHLQKIQIGSEVEPILILNNDIYQYEIGINMPLSITKNKFSSL